MRTSRRELLTWTAGAAAASAFGSLGQARTRSADLASAKRATASEVEGLVHWIVVTPREPAVRRGAREIARGMPPAQILGALLVAAARKVHPDLPGFNHAALVVASIDLLTGAALARNTSAGEREADVLWCLDYFKSVQEAQAGPTEWKWTPVDARRLPDGEHARQALVDALERWEAEAADAAILGFVRSAPLDVVYELVWEYGTRCRANIGHKAIYAAQSRRALPLTGGECAEDVLRSLVRTYFLHGKSNDAAAFEKSRELVAQGTSRANVRPASDLGPQRELQAELRSAESDALPAIAAKLWRDGADTGTLWDAIVIAAAEVVVANAGIGPLHAFTSTNALHHIALHAPSQRIAMLALLQAAAWVRLFRKSAVDGSPAAAAFRVDALEPLATADGNVLSGSRDEIARRAATAGRSEADAEHFRQTAVALVRAKADDVHEFKHAVAALEESRRVGITARPAVLAALAVHLPDPSRAAGEDLERVREAVAMAH